MRRLALLVLVCLGALAGLAAPALAAGVEPSVIGWINNASGSLPSGSGGVGWDAGPLSETQAVAVSGNYAYVPSYFDGTLTAVNLNSPNSPTIDTLSSIGTVPSNGTQLVGSDTVKVYNGVAYVVSKNLNASTSNNDIGVGNSLTMFNVSGSDADSPVYLGSISDATLGNDVLFGAYGVAVATDSGNGQTYAYVAAQGCLASPQPCQNGGGAGNNFVVINVTDPTAPTYVTDIHNPSTGQYANAIHHPTAIAISGNYAYVTSFYGADVAVIDISNPASPSIVATINNDTNNDVVWPNDLAISGNYLLIANQGGNGPVSVVDISNPLAPTIVGSVSNSLLNNAYRIVVSGDFAYVTGTNANTVAAIDISNPQSPRLAGYVTDGTNLYRTTGVDLMPTAGGLDLVATSTRQPTGEGGSDLYPPYPPGISSYPVTGPSPPFSYGSSGNTDKTGTVAAIQVDPSTPNSVTIATSSEPGYTTGQMTSQTSADFSFATADAVATVACQLDAGSLGPCTSPTTMNYTGLALGSHTFTVQSTDASGNTTSDQYTWTVTPPAGPPANTQAPTITGSPQLGQTLTVVDGTWSNYPSSFAHQWEDCDASGNNCQPISGATGQSYTLTGTDVGDTIVVMESATNSAGTGQPAASAPTQVVVATPVNTQPPVISGTTVQGETLTTSNGTWTGGSLTYTYAWGDCSSSGTNCSVISGATASTYTLTASDVGHEIQVKVFAHNSAGSTTAKSQPTAVVTAASVTTPVNTTLPGITGTVVQGHTLTASTGTWTGGSLTYTYAWGDCSSSGLNCTPISGATAATYTLRASDVGHEIQVKVTAHNSAGSTSAKSHPTMPVKASAAGAAAAPTVKVRPVVRGTIAVGQTVASSHGTWSGSGVSYAYAWSRCAARGGPCDAIPRATHALYRLTAADAGKRLIATVTATDRGGSTAAPSLRTAIVAQHSVSLTLAVTAASGRHVGRSGTLVVRVRCRASALLGAYAEIKVGKASAFASAQVMGQSGAGRALRLTLRLTRAQAAAIRDGLAHRLRVAARIYPLRATAPGRPPAIGPYRQVVIVS